MKTLFTIGKVQIPFFGTMIMLGVLVALKILYYEAKRKNLNPNKVVDMAMTALLGGVIGARIGYIVFYDLEYYLKNPLQILRINEGGLSIHGGVIGGVIAALMFLNRNKELKILETSDLLTPPLILAQAIGRIGCDVYGIAMKTPKSWGIPVSGIVYHPAQAYEIVLDYILFFYLWRKRKNIKYQGQLFGNYLIGFALIRSTVELFRDNPKLAGIVSVSHMLSLLMLVSGLIWLKVTSKNRYLVKDESKEQQKPLYIEGIVVFVLVVVSIGIFYGGQLNL